MSKRSGFTLIELMMVIVVVVILTGLLAVASMSVLGSSREAATKTTLKIAQKIIDDRNLSVSAVLKKAPDIDPFLQLGAVFSSEIQAIQNDRSLTPAQIPPMVRRVEDVRDAVGLRLLPFQSADDRTRKVIAMIEWQRLLLPQTWAEADFHRCVKRLPAVSSVNEATENSEVLLFMLTQGVSAGLLSIDADAEAITPSMKKDTDGNGEMELVDSWGNPIRFYRWPTRLVNFVSVDNKKFGQLFLPSALIYGPEHKDPNNPLALGSGGVVVPEFYDPDTFHAPLLVSAGADGKHGMRNPVNKTDGGYWGELMPEDIVPEPPMATVILENPGHRDIFDDLTDKTSVDN